MTGPQVGKRIAAANNDAQMLEFIAFTPAYESRERRARRRRLG